MQQLAKWAGRADDPLIPTINARIMQWLIPDARLAIPIRPAERAVIYNTGSGLKYIDTYAVRFEVEDGAESRLVSSAWSARAARKWPSSCTVTTTPSTITIGMTVLLVVGLVHGEVGRERGGQFVGVDRPCQV